VFGIGSQIEKYEVLAEMGEGGMARVLKVRHTLLGSVHALKVLDPKLVEDPELRKRFLAEGQIQARLRHSNIVAVTDVVVQPGTHERPGVAGLVMDFVEGPTLAAHIATLKAMPSIDDVEAIFLPLLDALGHAHASGVVHRDIKPANIILGKNPDGSLCPKILDFGIARVNDDLLGPGQAKSKTRTGARMGTVHYMSPEQIKGAADIDGRTDIFALAVTLYEFIARRVPFDGDSDFDIWRSIVEGTPTPIRQIEPDVDPILEACFGKGLIADRERRFRDCGEFKETLHRVAQTSRTNVATSTLPSTAAPSISPSPTQPTAKSTSSGVLAYVVLAVVGMVFLGFGALAYWVIEESPRAQAAKELDFQQQLASIQRETSRQTALLVNASDDTVGVERRKVMQQHLAAINELRARFPERLAVPVFAANAEIAARQPYVKSIWDDYLKRDDY
jgi:serine/threonine-protein kinase